MWHRFMGPRLPPPGHSHSDCHGAPMTGYTLALAIHRKVVTDDYPNCRAYIARLSERPAYQVASAAG